METKTMQPSPLLIEGTAADVYDHLRALWIITRELGQVCNVDLTLMMGVLDRAEVRARELLEMVEVEGMANGPANSPDRIAQREGA